MTEDTGDGPAEQPDTDEAGENPRLRAYRRWKDRRDRIRQEMRKQLREADLMLHGELTAYDEEEVPPLTVGEKMQVDHLRLLDGLEG